ncbi:MAG: metalloregulator ArsR/SmtB family transcription factor [Clostridium sp.]
MEENIKVFKAFGDETRIKILSLISIKSMCAKGIAKHLNITEAAVSQQIKILKDSNLIIGYKVGYNIFYDINEMILQNAIDFIQCIGNVIEVNKRLICLETCKHKKCSHNEIIKEELTMKVCFPVKSNEGIDSIPYGHFGTAPQFVVCDINTNEVKSINNGDLGHEHGHCQPMKALAGEVVDAVVVGGIGQGAITRLNSMGIKVYRAIEGNIEKNIEAYKKEELMEFPNNHTCNHDGCSH